MTREVGRNTAKTVRLLAGPIILAISFAGLAFAGWRRWPDVLIDFGRELYIPWRLSQGEVLYRDLAYFNGPLASGLNGLLFRVFDPSYTVLQTADLLLTALVAVAVYGFFAVVMDRLAAFVATMFFLLFFGLAHFTLIGNYTWASPYSHDITLGTALGVFLVLVLSAWAARERKSDAALAGLCYGLCFLTKPETFLAATAACLGTVVLVACRRRATSRIAATAVFTAGAFFPVAASAILASGDFTVGQWLGHLMFPWRLVGLGEVSRLPFYVAITGLDEPARNIGLMLLDTVSLGLLVLSVILGTRLLVQRSLKRIALSFCVICLWVISLHFKDSYPWIMSWRTFTPVTALLCGYFFYQYRKESKGPRAATASRYGSLCIWSCFALALLGKILLLPKFFHYGFALAMPAGVLTAAFILFEIPRNTAANDTHRRKMQLAFGLLLFVDLLFAASATSDSLRRKTVPVGAGGDVVMAFPTEADISLPGPAVQQALKALGNIVPPDKTLVVLPEGVMLNYLSRRRNPTLYVSFLPPELVIFGEKNIISELDAKRPEYILLAPRRTPEYAPGAFGEPQGFGRQIMDWVRPRYHEVWQGDTVHPGMGGAFRLLEQNRSR